nr:zinc finger, CCHC-type [Tanacetum cinerariifolium]
MKEDDTMDAFTAKLHGYATKDKELGKNLDESLLVRKLLDSTPDRFIQIVVSIEQTNDLDDITLDEIVGKLKAFEERIKFQKEGQVESQENLLFAHGEHSGKGRRFSKRGGQIQPGKYATADTSIWYLDNGESNHMTGTKSHFRDIDESVTGRVHFGDGSYVQIKGRGSILVGAENENPTPVNTENNDNTYQEQEPITDRDLPITPPAYTYNPNLKEEEEATIISLMKSENRFDDTPYEEASTDKKWIEAMEIELDSINKNNTWTLTTLPTNQKEIGLKWVFKTKRDAKGKIIKYKARLVGKGYVQEQGIDFDEVFAPVARIDTVRLILALTAYHGWQVHHLDVKSAFLHEDLKEEVDVTQLKGFIQQGNSGKVYKLTKALFMQDPKDHHLKAVKQVIRYIKGTKEHGIIYKKECGCKITRYSDSDYEINTDQGKGTTGIVLYFRESPITWCTQKQLTVALSLCESEFMAATRAACQALWLKRLLSEITGWEEERITLKVDNISAIALVRNPVFHGRSKHIDIRYHFIRKCVENGHINMEHVSGELQREDILTKALPRLKFVTMRQMLGFEPVDPGHPSTFATLAMDTYINEKVKDDFDSFVASRDYYLSVGKARKRGHEVIVGGNRNRSIVVVEDIDYLVELHDRESAEHTKGLARDNHHSYRKEGKQDLDDVPGLPPLSAIEDMRYEKNTRKSTRADIKRQKQEEAANARVIQVDSQGVDGQPSIPPHKPSFIQALPKENNLTNDSSSVRQAPVQPQQGMHKGAPAIFFPSTLIEDYLRPYQYALVGKFSQGRPLMDTIRKFLSSQGFKDTIWVALGEDFGFWQKVEPDEKMPSYCSFCWHLGHSQTTCHGKHPERRPTMEKHVGHPTEDYKPKKVETKVRTNHVKEMVRTKEDDVLIEKNQEDSGEEEESRNIANQIHNSRNEKNDARNMRNGMSDSAREVRGLIDADNGSFNRFKKRKKRIKEYHSINCIHKAQLKCSRYRDTLKWCRWVAMGNSMEDDEDFDDDDDG